MLIVMDSFAEAVDRARRALGRMEGKDEISIRELARRAGLAHSTLAYTLRDRPEGGRRVRREVLEALAPVIEPVMSKDDLFRAARVAAGYEEATEVRETTDLGDVVVRYLSQPLTDRERRETLARLHDILAEEMRREIRDGDR